MSPLVGVSLATAGTNPAVAAFRLKDPFIAVLAIVDKAAILMAIAIHGFFDFFELIVGYFMRLNVRAP